MTRRPDAPAMIWVRRTAYLTILAISITGVITGTAASASAATADAQHAIEAHASTPSPTTRAASPKATMAPASSQPTGSGVPWSTLITAASTLAAGLGGILLKATSIAGKTGGQRQRDAYAGLMLSLDELVRVIGSPLTVSSELRAGPWGRG